PRSARWPRTPPACPRACPAPASCPGTSRSATSCTPPAPAKRGRRIRPLRAWHAVCAVAAVSAHQPAYEIEVLPAPCLPPCHTPVRVVTLCLPTIPAAHGGPDHPGRVTRSSPLRL